MNPPKYALSEIERRWFVPAELAQPLLQESPVKITDTYLRDSRLRLRRVDAADGSSIFKFCRKYGDRQGPSESITNLYLDEAEYDLLAGLPGVRVCKHRHRLAAGAIDVYGDRALHIFEIEFDALEVAMHYTPPDFVSREITGDEAYSGLALASQYQ